MVNVYIHMDFSFLNGLELWKRDYFNRMPQIKLLYISKYFHVGLKTFFN